MADRLHPSPNCTVRRRRTLLDRILRRPARVLPSSFRISPSDVLIHPDLLRLYRAVQSCQQSDSSS